ncbi:hypothetical protein DB30_02059 [Enhygromyxa salina]|uniref:Uncharacterized protein n=1 Tax=Enhygromyxa salina TaxID=215803 RepID=A0A0C2CQU3_9BACT|nr:hypothetical protein [Enhygromyxa salina]KIG12085.1 hypothetical protein DB30_02059 [Enhygromyxa salina]
MLDDIRMPSSHGGLVFPLDMFRPTMLAAALAEGLIAHARNILDAKLELVRHPEVQLVLARITGSVIGDDPAGFWRENVELGVIASQVLPRQLFLYWVAGEPNPRQGFVVTQRGQVLGAQDATPDQLPPDATAADWPVAQLLKQLQVEPDELASGFAGGPRVELSLIEPEGDDRSLLMTLVGQQPEDGQGDEGDAGDDAGPDAPASSPQAGAAPAATKRVSVEDDKKRRAAEHKAELDARAAKADSIRADLPYVVDDLGIVVAPKGAELADSDILRAYLIPNVEGELPAGIDRDLRAQLQGKRVDFAVGVEFLSEMFAVDGPLTKALFEQASQPRMLGGAEVRVLEVLGPRLGRGSYIRRGRAGVFVSRVPELALPDALILELLGDA